MDKLSETPDLTTRRIMELCRNGQAAYARRHLVTRLSTSPSKAQEKNLLQNLFLVEMQTGRVNAAFDVLERRRAMGYRTAPERMDAALHSAVLLERMGRLHEARDRLAGILREPAALEWPSLLDAIGRYVAIDASCREEMEKVLSKAYLITVKRFGLPRRAGVRTGEVSETIKEAHGLFHKESKEFSRLFSRSLASHRAEERTKVIGEIRNFLGSTSVGFFRKQAKDLLKNMGS